MKRPIRVHIVRTHWSHWGAHAGIVRYFDYLDADAVRIADVPTPNGDAPRPLRPRRFWDWLRARVSRDVDWYRLTDLSAEVRAAKHVAAGHVDVLHYLDPEHGLQYLPLALRRVPARLRPRLVATFHQPPKLLEQIMRRDSIECLDEITLVSPDQAEYFDGIVPSERVHVILHGIDAGFFSPPPQPREPDHFTCLTVGHNLRDFEAVGAVARRLAGERDIRFVVVAPLETGLEELPNVRIVSGLSDEELRALYRSAGALLLPLRDATANNALLEAFACALPAVTTDLPSLRAYAPDGEAILVKDNDADQLTDAVLALRADSALAARYGAAGRRRAEALDWSRIAPMYVQLYVGDGAADALVGRIPAPAEAS